jgi:hypothetical protein
LPCHKAQFSSPKTTSFKANLDPFAMLEDTQCREALQIVGLSSFFEKRNEPRAGMEFGLEATIQPCPGYPAEANKIKEYIVAIDKFTQDQEDSPVSAKDSKVDETSLLSYGRDKPHEQSLRLRVPRMGLKGPQYPEQNLLNAR